MESKVPNEKYIIGSESAMVRIIDSHWSEITASTRKRAAQGDMWKSAAASSVPSRVPARDKLIRSGLILDKNVFLSVDLIGFDVIIESKIIGKITEIIDTPANEVLVLDSRVMIPYVKDFIKNINKESKIVEVNDVKGLL